MSYDLTRAPIGDGVHFNSVTHPKFKHNRLTVNFVVPLAEETASDYAAAALVLRKGCRICPDFTSLNARLAELYGAVLDADVSKYGAYQILEVSIRGLDDRFALENEKMAEQCAELLACVTLDPNFDENGLFREEDVALERQYLIDSIDAEINDKRAYALRRCKQAMCEGESVAVPRYGRRSTAEKIIPASVTGAYRNLLQTAAVEVFFTGCGNPEGAKAVFTERFRGRQCNVFAYEPVKLRGDVESVKEICERMEIVQSKMVLGMRTGSVETRQQVNALRLFSALFGATPFSKLFLNVREKLSLCYYCSSRFDSATKLLIVDSGVDSVNKQKAQEEILVQLKALQDGDFTDEDLAQTKMLMKNSITTITDSLSGLEGFYTAQILRGQRVTPEQDAQEIDALTRDEVIAAAKGVALEVVYFLTGTEKED